MCLFNLWQLQLLQLKNITVGGNNVSQSRLKLSSLCAYVAIEATILVSHSHKAVMSHVDRK